MIVPVTKALSLRGQLLENPLRYVKPPKVTKPEIHTYSLDECLRLIRTSRESKVVGEVRWDLMILLALYTGMRRGELLNLTWPEIDFEHRVIHIKPQKNSEYTWEWQAKDSETRKLPLTEGLVRLLVKHQMKQPERCPYIFVPESRYRHIQELRQENKWKIKYGRCPLNNFTRQLTAIRREAGIDKGTFHDLRRTCFKNLLENGLGEYDHMNLAGHSTFETTHRFYLSVSDSLLQRARVATEQLHGCSPVANLLQDPFEKKN